MKITTLAPAVRVENEMFPGFYALIVTEPDNESRSIYLCRDGYGTIVYMLGTCRQSDGRVPTAEEAADLAYHNMRDYIPELLTAEE
jgi:hypothetical protein